MQVASSIVAVSLSHVRQPTVMTGVPRKPTAPTAAAAALHRPAHISTGQAAPGSIAQPEQGAANPAAKP
jgi:hypothetical protein